MVIKPKSPPTEIEAEEMIRPANGLKRIMAGLLDGAILAVIVIHSLKYFNFEIILPDESPVVRQVYLCLYFYLLLIVIPHTIFSQSLGQFLMRVKVVSVDKYERLSLFVCLKRDLFLFLVFIAPFSLFNSEGQAMHDKIAKSVVVNV